MGTMKMKFDMKAVNTHINYARNIDCKSLVTKMAVIQYFDVISDAFYIRICNYVFSPTQKRH